MSKNKTFTGPLAEHIRNFLNEKRTLGYKYEEQERVLSVLDRMSQQFDCSNGLPKALCLAFIQWDPNWKQRTQEQRVILAVIIHSLAGYAIGRSMAHSKVYSFIYLYIVSGMFVPFAILMMPVVKLTAQMGLANRVGVILLYTVFYMPMNLLLYSGYLKNIPLALEEAARVDGATTWKTYWSIIFPVMKPMHATVAVLTALGTWNDVMTPLVILSGTNVNTLPLAQLNFQTQFGTNYNLAFASYLLALIPILIFYLVCQKQILNGVVNGAVK